MRLPACALALLVTVQGQPTFRSGVDIIRIDVSVVDKDGRPVRDLRPEEFVVTIDGTPRKVASARFYGPDSTPPESKPTDAAPTYATNRMTAPGRVVVFVVDLESMNAGYERLLLNTAGSLIDGLAPGDAVGLVPLPGKGIEITRDRARVRDAMVNLKGFSPKIFQQHVITMREALAFERIDKRVISEVIERECRREERECPMDLRNESGQLLIEARRRIRNVLTTLTALNARLQPIDAPKDIVLLSAGLPFEQETISLFRDLQRRVSESGTATHIVQLAQPDIDASTNRMAGAGSLPASDLRQGLSMVAGMTGGDFFEGVGRAKGVFERIQAEVTHSWQLGVAATPQDADGKPHKVNVTTTREGLTTRARRELILATAPRAASTAANLLAQPVDAVELPIAAASYTARGEEPTTLKQIILVHADSIGTDAPPAYALSVMKDDRVLFQTNDSLAVTGQEAQAVIAAQLAPGRYRLRLAVVDAGGRGGSLEMPLSVGLRAGGLLQFSDVFVGTPGPPFTPNVDAAANAPIGALIELYAGDSAAFTGATVEFELRRSGSEAVLARAPGRISATDLPGRRIADGSLAATNLEPGDHVVSALIHVNGRPAGKVSRTIQIK